MIECPQCHLTLKTGLINNADFSSCPQCHSSIQVLVFPALFEKPKDSPAAELLLVGDQANCFYHPNKKAMIPCSSCGRFLCALCDIEFDQEHLCPACLQSGARKKKITNIDSETTCYDKIAFMVATVPILTVFFTIITAPMAIYIAIRYWNRKSLTGSRVRMVFAILIALVEIVVWFFIFKSIFTRHHG